MLLCYNIFIVKVSKNLIRKYKGEKNYGKENT